MADRILGWAGATLARFLQKPTGRYIPYSVVSAARLSRTLRRGDVLLVEGNSRISAAIKYLTQSTWSHAALCIAAHPDTPQFVEADVEHGVRCVGLEEFRGLNTRICRAESLSKDEIDRVCDLMRQAIGRSYDLKNVWDLARYLLPHPPVPRRFRRKLIAFGSGDPTRAICSTLIAEAFQSVRYPILPIIESDCPEEVCREILTIRHHSLFVPRDFDLSPYFRVVKPTLEEGFDHTRLEWSAEPAGADIVSKLETES